MTFFNTTLKVSNNSSIKTKLSYFMVSFFLLFTFSFHFAQGQIVKDTLTKYYDRTTNLSLPKPAVSNTGFVFGTSLINMRGYIERTTDQIGMFYEGTKHASTVTDVMVYFGYLGVKGTNDIFKVNMHEVDNGFPGAIISSGSLSTSNIKTGGDATIVSLDNPIKHTGNFFVVLDYSLSDDTFAVYSNNVNGDAKGEQRAVQRMDAIAYSGNWYYAENLWNLGGGVSQPLDCDIMLVPIIQYDLAATSVEQMQNKTSNSLSISPNPSNTNTTVSFHVDKHQPVDIVVTNITGNSIYQHTQLYNSGIRKKEIPTMLLAEGLYFVTVRTSTYNITKRLHVKH